MNTSNQSFLLPTKFPLVVKIGSGVLADDRGQIQQSILRRLCRDIAELIQAGQSICLVSSGAISAGLGLQGLTRGPKEMQKKQALAAIGQVALMQMYSKAFQKYDLKIAQILLTHEGLATREGFLNTRKTMSQLLKWGIIPIINENDTVSTQEIQFGENDRLAVLVANIVEAQKVVFLSTAAGLLEMDEGEKLIPVVEKIDSKVLSLARGSSKMGTGGMGSKLMAIRSLNQDGKSVFLTDGRTPGILKKLLDEKAKGTVFLAQRTKPLSSKRQWMKQHLAPKGKLFIDQGATKALLNNGASLLLPGIQKVEGHFKAGHLVAIVNQKKEIARGMCRLDSEKIKSILGKSQKESLVILGEKAPKFAIHRNDIVLSTES